MDRSLNERVCLWVVGVGRRLFSLGRTGREGLVLAGMTASISGVSVFVNSHAVHEFSSPVMFTAAKNLVAAIVLLAGASASAAVRLGSPAAASESHGRPKLGSVERVAGLAFVGVVGGGIAFALFFSGLARSSPAPAAFLHDTLIIFVALLAWPMLTERVNALNLVAMGMLVVGEVVISGGIGQIRLSSGSLLILGATVLWAIETIVAKRLLRSLSPMTIALTRMGVGSLVLVADLALTGGIGELGRLDQAQIGWVLVTGLLLGGYVATWFGALARARAIDVTSILVASVILTSILEVIEVHSLPVSTYVGVGIVAAGIALWPKSKVREPS